MFARLILKLHNKSNCDLRSTDSLGTFVKWRLNFAAGNVINLSWIQCLGILNVPKTVILEPSVDVNTSQMVD